MTAQPTLPFRLARWFEARLHQTIDFADSARGCHLYGLEVIDPEGLEPQHPGAARVCFIADADDIDSLMRHPDAARAIDFDAIALVSSEWRAVRGLDPRRPFEYPTRRRARVVEVRDHTGGATVIRFEHDPDQVFYGMAA
ncbi:MAG TPA: hypothetical protein PLV13_00590 [Ilumatobacteraceae bacterium]|nr:hypothetical protein [Ilumatobacteraceae bacterium]